MTLSDKCAAKYPILLVHGMGFRDHKYLNYWGRIPRKLTENGAKIYYGWQDSAASVENNAAVVLENLNKALADSGAEKVNIIAHSKGGLEARYIASSMGQSSKIASITTINTPHNGSLTVDNLMKMPGFLIKAAACAANVWMRLLGDKHPDALSCFRQFTTSESERFNRENPDIDGIFYQSFGFKMKNAFSDITMLIPYLVVKHYEGDNDGLLAERAVKWTNYRGMHVSSTNRGISHADEVDIRRMRFSHKTTEKENEVSDITQFYICIVNELKNKGL